MSMWSRNHLADLMLSSNLKGFELRPILGCSTAYHHRRLATARRGRWSWIEAVAPTMYGNNPFDFDEEGEFRCPSGHVAGLNLLTELTLSRLSWSGDDIVATRQLAGIREGALVPEPSFLISPALFRLIRDAGGGGLGSRWLT